jgi:hypothetical protein
MESRVVSLAAGRRWPDEPGAARCMCGEEIATVLARLGSPWCHDCRDDGGRRAGALTAVKNRAALSVDFVTGGRDRLLRRPPFRLGQRSESRRAA